MKKLISYFLGLIVMGGNSLLAQNPIINDQFTADPTARVFDGKVYLYPSHDIPAPPIPTLRKDWFCMEDYHVFSSSDLTEWTDHGVIVTQTKVPWAKPDGYSMWAPDCVYKNGKYYFYFPAAPDTAYGRGFAIGVAIADNPAGPFVPQPTPIKNVRGIDPNVFIDKDGQAYLYWTGRGFSIARLKENMVELDSEPEIIANLPEKGLKEGSWLFERNGIYYLTFPHVENKTERLEYAIGNSPVGPFKMAGVIMDESPSGCWTNHHSFIHLNNQWYLFYHHNDYSPKFDKNRSVRIDSLFFNGDGTIRKVIPSLRGVGLTTASKQIQIDRYSAISEKGVTVAFIDTSNTFDGWKTVFTNHDSWIQYNAVDFGNKKIKSAELRIKSENGGKLKLLLGNTTGPVIAQINVPKTNTWQTVKVAVSGIKPGVQNLVVSSASDNIIEVDWVSFN
ncbi:MAG: family 43 glycosylhydrolase [Bacteroidales bacterium]|nr:family 43 glycosylhydrolase [Bacteroidales bacterium]